MSSVFKKAKIFIHRNARPIELARWKYHFENGSKEDVISALSYFQNDDGGFGHALEADSFNPQSSPIQTMIAIQILREIDFDDADSEIIKGIIRYLDSGKDYSFKFNQWFNTIKSNNDYPHAIWWTFGDKGSAFEYNPSALLAGFAIKYADHESPLYEKSTEMVKKAYEYFLEIVPIEDMHITPCFAEMYNFLLETGSDLIDMNEFKSKLIEQVNATICKDSQRWENEYIAFPSDFVKSKDSMFYSDEMYDIIKEECQYMIDNQLEDGSYNVPWEWYTNYKEFELAKNWWKSDIIIKKMLFFRNFA